jgi:hypothetical protein
VEAYATYGEGVVGGGGRGGQPDRDEREPEVVGVGVGGEVGPEVTPLATHPAAPSGDSCGTSGCRSPSRRAPFRFVRRTATAPRARSTSRSSSPANSAACNPEHARNSTLNPYTRVGGPDVVGDGRNLLRGQAGCGVKGSASPVAGQNRGRFVGMAPLAATISSTPEQIETDA